MTELIDKMKLLQQIAEFGREIPKDQVIGVIARQEDVGCDGELISRQDAIEAMKAVSDSICEQQAVDAIDALPSADRPKGHWINKHENVDGRIFRGDRCSECGWWKSMGAYNFCPNCGSDNRERREE